MAPRCVALQFEQSANQRSLRQGAVVSQRCLQRSFVTCSKRPRLSRMPNVWPICQRFVSIVFANTRRRPRLKGCTHLTYKKADKDPRILIVTVERVRVEFFVQTYPFSYSFRWDGRRGSET